MCLLQTGIQSCLSLFSNPTKLLHWPQTHPHACKYPCVLMEKLLLCLYFPGQTALSQEASSVVQRELPESVFVNTVAIYKVKQESNFFPQICPWICQKRRLHLCVSSIPKLPWQWILESNLCSDKPTAVAELVGGAGTRGGLELHGESIKPGVSMEWENRSVKGTNLAKVWGKVHLAILEFTSI